MAAERVLGPLSHSPWQQSYLCTGVSALPERTEQPPRVGAPPACLRTTRTCSSGLPGRGKEAGRQKRHPRFAALGSLRDHRPACFVSQMERSKPQGGKSPEPGPGDAGSRGCAESHAEQGRRLPALLSRPGANPSWPWGLCGLAGGTAVCGRSEGQGRWMGAGAAVGAPGPVKLPASGC